MDKPPPPAEPSEPPPARASDDDDEGLGTRRSTSERVRLMAAVLLLCLAALAIVWFIETKWLAPLPDLPKEVGSVGVTRAPHA